MLLFSVLEFVCLFPSITFLYPKKDSKLFAIAMVNNISPLLTESGALYTWGRGSFGRLGLGSKHDEWIPKKVGFNVQLVFPCSLMSFSLETIPFLFC